MKNKPLIDYCYHTHTNRCGHAYGSDEEYIIEAIKRGFKVIGFSDHIFYPGLSQPGIRGEYSLLEDYLTSINYLKTKYKDQIEIHLGFESEYYSQFHNYYQELLDSEKISYLLLGQHHRLIDNQFDIYYGRTNDPDVIKEYRDAVIEAMATGLFINFVHPDLFMAGYKRGFDETAIGVSHDIVKAAVKYDIVLELNLGGIRGHGFVKLGSEYRYRYPYEPFWEIVSRYPVKVNVGIDAHSPNDFSDERIKILLKIIDKYKLNHIHRLLK
jgi:histidinol-phosphatase (PHP family)